MALSSAALAFTTYCMVPLMIVQLSYTFNKTQQLSTSWTQQNYHHWSQHKSMFQQPPKHHRQIHDEQWLIASAVVKMACRSFLPQTLKSDSLLYVFVSVVLLFLQWEALLWLCPAESCDGVRGQGVVVPGFIEDLGNKAAGRAKGEALVGGCCCSCSGGSELGTPG